MRYRAQVGAVAVVVAVGVEAGFFLVVAQGGECAHQLVEAQRAEAVGATHLSLRSSSSGARRVSASCVGVRGILQMPAQHQRQRKWTQAEVLP